MAQSATPDVAALYESHREAMLRCACARLRDFGLDPEDALSVVHDVFTTLLNRRPTDVKNWEAYLVQATLNKITDKTRSAAVRHETTDPAAVDALTEAPSDDDPVEQRVLDELDRQQRQADFRAALNQLPPQQRQAVAGRVLEAHTNEEIAVTMGCTPQWVSALFRRGIETIRALLPPADASGRPGDGQ